MFGLTFEKLVLVTIIAAFVIGPRRLPVYAGKLAEFVRDLRAFIESSRSRAEADLGVPLRASEWQADLRRYDPRRIVRDALAEPPAPVEAKTRQRWVAAGGTSGHPRRILVTEPVPEEGSLEPPAAAQGEPRPDTEPTAGNDVDPGVGDAPGLL